MCNYCDVATSYSKCVAKLYKPYENSCMVQSGAFTVFLILIETNVLALGEGGANAVTDNRADPV